MSTAIVYTHLAAAIVIVANALNPSLVPENNIFETNIIQPENTVNSHINPLDYIFNHSLEFNQIHAMFDSLLNNRKEYEYNLLQLQSNDSIVPSSQDIQATSIKSFQPPHMCVASQDELSTIWSEINRNNSDKFHLFKSVTLTQSSVCNEIEKIKTGILMIKHNFDEMVRKEISSMQYKSLKSDYELKLKKLQHQFNEAQKTALWKEKMELDAMQNDLQVQRHQINNVLRKMESEVRLLNDAYIRLCISHLEQQNVSAAVAAYKNITEKSQIRRIIYAVYANKEENFERIFEFVRQTNDLESILLGYSSLFEHMKTNHHMNVMNLLLLTNAIIKHRETDGFKQLFNSLNDFIKVMHQDSDYETFYNFMYSKSNDSADFAKDMMATFVQGAYNGSIANVDKILNMIPKLNIMNHRLHLLNSLINEMKFNGHIMSKEIFMVVYQVIQARLATYTKSDEHDKNMINVIEQNLPDNVRDLMFTNLCIQNANNKEYLYSGPPADESRRYVFTSIINRFDDTFDFEMEFIDNGKKVLIKNSHYREHLYSTENGSPRTLLSWMPAYLTDNTEAHFSLEIVDGPFFRIRSEHYGEYLYSPSNKIHTESNRKAYFRPEDKVFSDSTWKIQTCRHRVRYE